MEKRVGIVCGEGLALFGKTNRLISHEIKNILAIISETLGLINELMELSDAGTALEPGKLRSLGESILEEVHRANGIVRIMNSFAHGVDHIMTEADIGSTVSGTIELFRLDPRSRNMPIRFSAGNSCSAYTSPLFVGVLVYGLLDSLLIGGGVKGGLLVSVDGGRGDRGDRGNTEIIFSGITPGIMKDFPSQKEAALAEALSAELSLDAAKGNLIISLPRKMNGALIEGLTVSHA